MDVLIQQRRLQHIIDSYSLVGRDGDLFEARLSSLVESYPYPAVELALVETLVGNWLRYPLPRGLAYLEQVENLLQQWVSSSTLFTALTPEQFEHVTGLPPLEIGQMMPSRESGVEV